MKILVIGDSCEDVFIYGDIERIAPEAPVPVLVPVEKKSNPGMAGNVVANLKALGATVDLITNKESIRKIRYVDERYNQMVLRVDENDECMPIDFNEDWQNCINTDFDLEYDAIVVSDYDKGFLTLYDIAHIGKKAKCPTFLDTKKELGSWCKGMDYIKINHLEYQKNSKQLSEYPNLHKQLIVTKGKHGCEYQGRMYATTDVPVKDVSGAGDTFLAGLVYEYINTNNIDKAIQFAQECTTIVVQKQGVATV